jgi:hypothetical protein
MEQRDNKDEIGIFTSNEDILREYGDIFEKESVNDLDFYFEKDFGLDKYDPFRFIITPSGLVALSTSSAIPNSVKDVWALSTKTPTVGFFLQALDHLVEMNIGNYNLKDLQGSTFQSIGYYYRIYQYNHKRDSEIIKSVLDERRMGFLMYKAGRDTLGE